MIIRSVKLLNFRNHTEYEFKCQRKTSLILGPNGSGKTSVLEAIYETLQGKSFRATDSEIVRRGAEFYEVETEFFDGEKIVANFDNKTKKKTFLIQEKRTIRLPRDKKYPAVLFLPDDLHIVSTSPTKKREFFDLIIRGIVPSYATMLSRYNKVLMQRNTALKKMNDGEIQVDSSALFSWDLMLSKLGVSIRKKRQEVIDMINSKITDVYCSIADNDDKLEIEYKIQGDKEVTENQYFEKLNQDFSRDLILGHTGYGVHRDNFEFLFNLKNADGSASRGETRTMVLALKFIEAELMFNETKKRPVVLLDDVFSELDEKRQASLIKNFKDNQVIITSVDAVEL